MIDDLAMEFPHDTPQLAINTTGIGYLVNGTLNEENGVSLGGMDGAFLPKTGVVEIPFMYSDDINRTVQQYSSHHRVQRFLRNIITPIICVLGFLGNIINIIVLSRLRLLRNDGTRDSGTHLGLTVLAVSDMLFCMSMFPRCLVPESLSLFEKKDFYLYYQVGSFFCFRYSVPLVKSDFFFLSALSAASLVQLQYPVFRKNKRDIDKTSVWITPNLFIEVPVIPEDRFNALFNLHSFSLGKNKKVFLESHLF